MTDASIAGSPMGSVQYRVVLGKKDEVVAGPDGAEVVGRVDLGRIRAKG